MLLLCSPSSIKRHWIHFEAGCGWIQKKPVIPICYGGLTSSQLPANLMNAICKNLKAPNVDAMLLRGMFDDLKTVISDGTTEVENEEVATHSDEQQEQTGINGQQIEIMNKLANNPTRDDLTANLLANWMSLNQLRVEAQLSKLEEKGYVHVSYAMNQEPTYRLAPLGSELLMDRGLI